MNASGNPIVTVQWTSENRTFPVFEWSIFWILLCFWMVTTSLDHFIQKKIFLFIKQSRLVENSISDPVFEPLANQTQKVSGEHLKTGQSGFRMFTVLPLTASTELMLISCPSLRTKASRDVSVGHRADDLKAPLKRSLHNSNIFSEFRSRQQEEMSKPLIFRSLASRGDSA
jgi:hypothetical protein